MKVTIDRDKCTALGICESLAPDFFEVDEDGELMILREDVPEDQKSVLLQAVAGCPTAALALSED